MTGIIEDIYNHMLSANRDFAFESRDLLKKDEELWNKVRTVLDEDTINELQDSQSALALHSNLGWFREGVRVGISLMLELQ